jgi:hypothetical protein
MLWHIWPMLFQYGEALLVNVNLTNTFMSASFKTKIKAANSGK